MSDVLNFGEMENTNAESGRLIPNKYFEKKNIPKLFQIEFYLIVPKKCSVLFSWTYTCDYCLIDLEETRTAEELWSEFQSYDYGNNSNLFLLFIWVFGLSRAQLAPVKFWKRRRLRRCLHAPTGGRGNPFVRKSFDFRETKWSPMGDTGWRPENIFKLDTVIETTLENLDDIVDRGRKLKPHKLTVQTKITFVQNTRTALQRF